MRERDRHAFGQFGKGFRKSDFGFAIGPVAHLDVAVQKAKITDVMKRVAEDLPVITLFSNPAWYEYSTRNFTGWPDKDNAWARPNNPAGIHERVKVLLSLTPKAK